ncbi:MAG TPA: NYN domain-containing protein [Candidatus Saccharimonadales bacterium]|nr:NYN domain-containing protein [Candidatus Saccharimonadales bacterium]
MRVYIDGENFRKGLTKILKDSKVIKNDRELTAYPIRALLEDVLGAENIDISYYASKIKLPNGYTPSKHILNHVQIIQEFTRKWVPTLAGQQIDYIKAGNLKVKSSKECSNCHQVQDVLQEKGVDVRIAIDMLEDVYDKKQKTVVIMSSDTDLCPALHSIKKRRARVIYVCFADSTNRAVSAVANETVSISIEKLKKYAGRVAAKPLKKKNAKAGR